jgi:hypothetical protein
MLLGFWFIFCFQIVVFNYSTNSIFCLSFTIQKVYVCGFDYGTKFAKNVLGASETIPFPPRFEGTPNDIVVATWKCEAEKFAGVLMYIDGESGKCFANLPEQTSQVIYLGVSRNVSMMVKFRFSRFMDSSITRINLIYGPSIFEYDRQIFDAHWSRSSQSNQSQRTEFMAYVAGNCVPERQRVFDALVNFSQHHGRSRV